MLSDKSQLAPCLTGLARREPGGGSAWQELGASAQAPCTGGEGRTDSCQPEPQTVPGLGFFGSGAGFWDGEAWRRRE